SMPSALLLYSHRHRFASDVVGMPDTGEMPKQTRVPQGRHLSERFFHIKRNSGISQHRFEFFFVGALSMVLGLVFDVMFYRFAVGAADAERAVSFLPCEINPVFA